MEGAKSKVVIVEDNRDLTFHMGYFLVKDGFDVDDFEDGESFLKKWDNDPSFCKNLAVVILDIGLPGISGVEVLEKIKTTKNKQIPQIVVYSARDDLEEKRRMIELGADLYLDKSVSIEELVSNVISQARIFNELYHKNPQGAGNRKFNSEDALFEPIEGIIINTLRREIVVDGINLDLTNKEYEILNLLIFNVGNVVPYSEIAQKIYKWESASVISRIRMTTTRIRKKLRDKCPRLKDSVSSAFGEGLTFTV
ncbi:MAG: response regulator transcription factor [Candidatus Ancillula sp.]|jgi:DNA-binding response OmpR family regulator|nr:response regulator transcription factor [Candidatus Ancillula sp.]